MAMVVAAVATAVGAGGKVIGGMMARDAAKSEAGLMEDQGRLALEESQEEAQRHATERRKFAQRQKLSFLKNGVTLEGSPLFVLDETFRESQKEVDSIVKRGTAQRNLAFRQAGIMRNKGRAAMIGGITGAIGDAGSFAMQANSTGASAAGA